MAKIPFITKPLVGNLFKGANNKVGNEKIIINGKVSELINKFNSGAAHVVNSHEHPHTNDIDTSVASVPIKGGDNQSAATLTSKIKSAFAVGDKPPARADRVKPPLAPKPQFVAEGQLPPESQGASAFQLPTTAPLPDKPVVAQKPIVLPKMTLLAIYQQSIAPIADNASIAPTADKAVDITATEATMVAETTEKKSPAQAPLLDRALTESEQASGKVIFRALKKTLDKNQYEVSYKQQYQQMKEGENNNEIGTFTLKMSYPDEKIQVHFVDKKAIGFQSTKDTIVAKDSEEEGASKRLATKGEYFVSLEMKKGADVNDKKEEKLRNINKESLTLFKGLTAIHPTLFVDKDHAIARNGGVVLIDHVFPPDSSDFTQVVALKYFENTLKDLKTLHSRGVHLIDIKLENMAFNGKKVVIIDTDDFIQKGNTLESFTEEYSVREIMTAEQMTRRPDKKAIYRTNMDAFAAMLSIMEATQGEPFAAEEGNAFRPFGLRTKKGDNDDESELKRAESWIEQHIKPDHQEAIKQLAKQPEKLTIGVELYDAIDWGLTRQQ